VLVEDVVTALLVKAARGPQPGGVVRYADLRLLAAITKSAEEPACHGEVCDTRPYLISGKTVPGWGVV
jgi:hypothetical protein